MHRRKIAALLALGTIVFVAIVVLLSTVHYKSEVSLNGKAFLVDVAETAYLQEKGLSVHPPLNENEGMLFVFKEPDTYSFWMKDMLFAIDILWFDKDLKLIHLEKSVSPDSYPKTFYPPIPALYVLEIKAGESAKLNVKIGDTLQFIKKYF